ncbi:hypothetical protein [Vibrio gallaecicus]|uniref:hypothetical protein n=1 Tax=Vibrio gallaecicus TaxID=552386 RepID=UPI0025B3AD9C|nr:hypothetical protein [Vibrio gallaecicus]MDN3616536.1 hypothetical protein [Vibrio gallaecicus]
MTSKTSAMRTMNRASSLATISRSTMSASTISSTAISSSAISGGKVLIKLKIAVIGKPI